MGRRKLTPGEIVERLRVIEALADDGQPLADAIRLVGWRPSDYLRWRLEYAGLLRTLGPLSEPPHGLIRRPRLAARGRRRRTLGLLH